MPTFTIPITDKCSQLVVTTNGVPITSIDGRLTGNQVSFLKFTYADHAMRRKAELLQYKPKGENKKQKYSYLTKNSYYSNAKLQQFINNRTIDCNLPSSSSCSGVVGSNMIYQLNTNVPYFSSL
jgi:hypothetical protein